MVAAALYTKRDDRLVGNDYRTHAQTMGSYGSERENMSAGNDNRTANGKRIGSGAGRGAHYKTVGLIGGETLAIDAGMDGYHRGVVTL